MKEQKILYFDIINGISGDMTLATLLDLGVPKQIFLEELDKLNLGKEFKIEITDKFENGIKGTNVNVVVNEGHVHRNLIDIYDIIDIVFCRRFWFMRITKSKATDPTYHVIQDVKRD